MGAALIAEQGLRAISMELQEHTLTAQLTKRDSSAFEEVFKMYFKNLHAYACTILKDEADAEEAVQQVFFKLWERAEHLSFSGSVAAYLYRAVHNQCLNQLKHQQVKANHQLHVAYSVKNESVNGPVKMISKELEQKIREALNELPEQCRTIFQLSRFEEMKYREIADQLDISIKTVENQMGKALKQLRLKLVDFLTLLFLIIHF